MRVQRLETHNGSFIDLVADSNHVRLETAGGLVVTVLDRPAENRIEVAIDNRHGRLDIQEMAATDVQARMRVAGVLVPSGATLAGVTQRLMEIEWVSRVRDDGSHYGQCPACARFRGENHDPGCWLGAFLGQRSSTNPGGHKL